MREINGCFSKTGHNFFRMVKWKLFPVDNLLFFFLLPFFRNRL